MKQTFDDKPILQKHNAELLGQNIYILIDEWRVICQVHGLILILFWGTAKWKKK